MATPFEPGRLTPVDLDLCPARASTPSAVIVDDFLTDGGYTSIGPGFPEGETFGAVYLELGYWGTLQSAQKPALPPTDAKGRDFEYKTVLYRPGTDDPRAGKRYVGVYASIRTPVTGSTCEVDLYPRGDSMALGALTRLWIDLADPYYCDPASMTGLTEISASRTSGPLYLSDALAKQLQLHGPKLPIWSGG